ncbi:MAG: hypothetical protein JXD22_03825 [Sedimentisphaerales bacterium]|nr:hypothetical protein [Sedimentisphaerales bacterium]
MFSRFKKKTSPAVPDSSGNLPAQTDSRRIDEIEKTRRDLMLAALESFGDTATAPMNSFDLGLTETEPVEISPTDLHNDSNSAGFPEEFNESEDQELERQLLLDDYQSAPHEIQKTDSQFTAAGSSAPQTDQLQFDLAEQILAASQAEKPKKSLQSIKSEKSTHSLQTEPDETIELEESIKLVHDVEISRLTSPTASLLDQTQPHSPLSQTQPKPLLRPQNHLLDEILIGIVKADIAALCRNHKTIKTS